MPGNSLYLIVGSTKALLVGTGSGAPGLSSFVAKLAGKVPLEVTVTSDDPGQIGGLAQFSSHKVYLPKGMPKGALQNVAEVGQGDLISLGVDSAGPATIRVEPLSGHSALGLTLLDVSDRILLSGDALGAQAADAGLVLRSHLGDFLTALENWQTRTGGSMTPSIRPEFSMVYFAALRGGVEEGYWHCRRRGRRRPLPDRLAEQFHRHAGVQGSPFERRARRSRLYRLCDAAHSRHATLRVYGCA